MKVLWSLDIGFYCSIFDFGNLTIVRGKLKSQYVPSGRGRKTKAFALNGARK
jgi:hypothetical protein